MDDEQILYFISQLIIAVLFMHNKNILHRDIKSQNLFLTKENVLKLGDFGIA
jgi:NIMA (never in mitosis gene a)-related kinase